MDHLPNSFYERIYKNISRNRQHCISVILLLFSRYISQYLCYITISSIKIRKSLSILLRCTDRTFLLYSLSIIPDILAAMFYSSSAQRYLRPADHEKCRGVHSNTNSNSRDNAGWFPSRRDSFKPFVTASHVYSSLIPSRSYSSDRASFTRALGILSSKVITRAVKN